MSNPGRRPTLPSPWLPVSLGEALPGGWQVAVLDLADRIRLELTRGASARLRLALQAREPAPGDAAASAVGDAWLVITPSALPAVAYREAIAALKARIEARADGEGVASWLGRLRQRFSVRLDLDDGASAAEGGASRIEAALEEVRQAAVDRPVELHLWTGALDAVLWRTVRRAREAGAALVRVSLRLDRFATSARMTLDPKQMRCIDLELVLEDPPRDLGRLGAFLRRAVASGAHPRVVLRAELEHTEAPARVMALAAAVAACHCEPLQLRLPELSAPECSTRISDFLPLLAPCGTSPRLLKASVPDGEPTCLVPGRAYHGGASEGGDGFVHAAACAECPERRGCPGLRSAYAEHFGAGELHWPPPEPSNPVSAPTWQDAARLLLTGRPDARLQLGEILSPERFPDLPCVLPWVRLEHNSSGVYGPCCADYLAGVEMAPTGADPESLWRGPYLRSIREAMNTGGHPATCSKDCPVLAGGTARPESLVLRGGPPAAVENQIRAIAAILDRAVDVPTVPFELCLAVTSHCNYNCVMCCVDRQGPDDQLAPTFYEGLAGWLDRLLVLDANGGEPLASANFRSFLHSSQFERFPALRLHLTTNGSYLAPDVLDRYLRLPFSALTVSLNAATAETYAAVSGGLRWERIRSSLDGLLEASRDGRLPGSIRYSFVILRQNLSEVADFATMTEADGVGVRFLLPTGNRNDTSIMLDRALMEEAREALLSVRARLGGGNAPQDRADIAGILAVLDARLASGELAPL